MHLTNQSTGSLCQCAPLYVPCIPRFRTNIRRLPPYDPVSPFSNAPRISGLIEVIREVLYTKNAQPFLISGSGTLGWDQVAANLVEPGENALVLHSGYFGDSFQDWYVWYQYAGYISRTDTRRASLETYGAKVDQIKAEIGAAVSQEEIEKALRAKKYKVLTFTHVDTSTGQYRIHYFFVSQSQVWVLSCLIKRESNSRNCSEGFTRDFGANHILQHRIF